MTIKTTCSTTKDLFIEPDKSIVQDMVDMGRKAIFENQELADYARGININIIPYGN